ncbi:transcriptional regulator, TetR family [Streptoalloteichus tenebrarius]|uniref:Transcriptional regulator, TetR family n=1 Tax=Streptoalloteichus tenebrarius (strain ATCC 17920 / DSM 40477 / JCM 4838 / CBS 697.72 / NBRC 16177 / NCIMB 11028 / NRRL B-12390 / A12253. 1 / ISP 5477) TaxID=1933 RepID=A0ABT1HQ73_STRSD|nr:TetR/AcrR family transcriptional regulator C-terminal domain-containing protein [Streptoalloteichus tenebrarius]MCP2257665.1 transcriptional regulator, TetR family [Streptoalloteichus tenebrarius]BFE98626.1 TetR/AcrR family transcriptional regulator C-terminal domain-containing protein [Streptoalloteichus tenebrarius]
MSTQPISRRARPAKAPLSRDVIVRTGLAILDRDGLDALTMRRVAKELDTGPASLYVYVANRDDLMAAMLDEALAHLPLTSEGTWQEQLRTLATAAIEAMSRHEGLAAVALGAIPTGEHTLLVLDRLLALLKQGGLDDTTAAWALDLLWLHIAAAAAEQSTYTTRGASEEATITAADRRYAALPADRYPMITSLRQALLSPGDRDAWGLNVLINGILHTPAR